MSSVDDIYRLEKQLERTKPSDTEGLIDSIALLEADLDAGLVTTPTNLSPMDAGIASGRLGLDSAKNTALSAGNYLIGDDEAGAQRLKKAEVIEGQAGRLAGQYASFEEFIDNPGFSNFAEMTTFKLGQAVPSAIESLASGTAGAAIGFVTTGGVGAVPGFVGGLVAKGQAKRMIRKAIVDYAKGNATDEQKDVAQQAFKFGAVKSFNNAKRGVVPGAKAGAMSAGYYQGVAASFGESLETGQDKQEAAGLAALMGIPFAAADVAPEILFVKSLTKLGKSSGLKAFGGSVLKQGAAEALAEGSQESLIVAQRFQQDPNYDKERAVMRIADSAYSGLVAGKALGVASGTVKAAYTTAANALDKARQTVHEKTAPDGDTEIKNFEFDDLSPEGMAQVPLNELLYAVQDVQDGQTLEADPISQEHAASAIQELNRRAEEMGQNRFQELVMRELNAGKIADPSSELEQATPNESDLPEAGATEQRAVDNYEDEDIATAETTQGFEERLLGHKKKKKLTGYKIGSNGLKDRLAELQEENPGRQYRLVQKDGKGYVEEVVESSFDVTEIVNEGITKARAGILEKGADRTVPATDPQGKDFWIAPTELAFAGQRANNKDKANASSMTYPQLIMSGLLRMVQELTERGFKMDLDALPDNTVIIRGKAKNDVPVRTEYTYGDLKRAWAQRKDTREGAAFDGLSAKEQKLIETEEQIEKLGRDPYVGATRNELDELIIQRDAQIAEIESRDDTETDTTVMGELQALLEQDKTRILDEDGKAITYPTKKPRDGKTIAAPSDESISYGVVRKKGKPASDAQQKVLDNRAKRKAKKTADAQERRERIEQDKKDKQAEADQTKQATQERVAKAKAKAKPKPKQEPQPTQEQKPQPKAKVKPLNRKESGKVSFYGTFPDVFARYANAIIAAVGIKSKVHIMWADDLQAFNEQNGNPLAEASVKNASNGALKGFVAQRDGNAYIVLSNNMSNPYRQAIAAAVLGHELGHVLFKESRNSLSDANLARLKKAYQDQLKTKSNKQYTNDDAGFEEWYADQVSAWAAKQTKTPGKFAESHFKRIGLKMQQVWRKSRSFVRQIFRRATDAEKAQVRTLKDRFTLDETFEQYMDSVLESINVQESTAESTKGSTTGERVFETVGQLQGTPLMTKIQDALRKIWDSNVVDGLLKIILSADQYARVRLGKLGPAFANLFYHRSQSASNGLGDMLNKQHHALDKWNAQFAEILGEDSDTAREVLAEMQSGKPIGESVDPVMRKQLADFFERFHKDYLRKRIPHIGKVENYFPVVYNILAIQANPDAFLAELKKGGLNKRESQTVMRSLLESDGAFIDSVPNQELFGPQFNSKLQRVLKDMDAKAMQDLGFYQDPLVAVQMYLKQATKHAEYNVIKDEAEALIAKMSPKQQAQARKIVLGYMGRLGADIDPTWNKYQSYIAALQFATTLLFSVIASFTDLGNTIVRAKDWDGVKSAFKTWRGYMSKQSRDEMTEFAERIGAASRAAVQEALHQSYNSEYIDPGARKWSDKYFKAIGLEHWTRMTRIIAANMGRDFIITHTRKAAAGDARSIRYLKELNLTHEVVTKGFDFETDSIDLTTPEGEAIQEAILNFVDESIIRPNSAQRPVWASDPHYMLIWQLKSFFYTFGQVVVGGVAREMKSRWAEGDRAAAAMPAMLLFAALLPLAALAVQTRQLIKGLFKDDEREKEEDEVDYVFDLVDRAGILGPMSIIKSIFDAEDSGRSGVVSMLGPTAGTIETFLDGDMGNFAKRLTPIYSQL